jgi:DNA replicative helicase MCM subunit Mcm2 (Cdc46/Mcm family)
MSFAGEAIHIKVPEQVIVLESFEMGWTKKDLQTLRDMWKEDKPLEDIVYSLRPSEKGSFEVTLAIIDQLYRGYIQPREKHLIIGGLQ